MNLAWVPQQFWDWIAVRADLVPSASFRGLAVCDANRIYAMAGFDGWTKNAVTVSIAVESPIALRKLLPALFEYAFVHANKGVMVATVKGTNTKSLRLCEHVGMREAARVRDAIDVGVDLVIMEMRREDCRWLQKRKAA